ncbi:MAG TPA: N,N-dimethylformamidase beta subunit family domain-containing protein [Candidatus Angelobacter sp.]|nr:N,N-dimethylformamidase beta subunit family domain-containing protein [Candidatus Angelobacter sp.]
MATQWRKVFVFAAVLFLLPSVRAFGSCQSPVNAIEAENCRIGTPQSQWDVDVVGDPSIQGFATDISVNAGQNIFFKINTDATAYRLDIYRMGYYQGNGARLVDSVQPSATLPQSQPACLNDPATKLLDCGNWAVSASWSVPANAVSGIYFAHVIRLDTGGDSHIVFVVRNDASHADVLFQTSDETWQAYNDYGGNSLYGAAAEFDLVHRAYKVSYNRPSDTRRFEAASWVFYAEYAMVRWLEANSYDVAYFTSVDAARTGNLIENHKLYLSVGHDEYWSGPKWDNVMAARNAGVNLAFFSGNEAFWKTRWENSIDGSNTPYRTLVCYKETLDNKITDPTNPQIWTGTWADPRFSPPSDGGRPQNQITGQYFKVNGPGSDTLNQSIQVPAADGKMRFWRNTAISRQSAGQTWVLPAGTLGYEWDVDADNGFRPAGLFHLSTATYQLTSDLMLDFGTTFGAGTATHQMTIYRAPSGALVFGSGTVQWPFGLDDNHDSPLGLTTNGTLADPNMQQATVNLFADMGVQPGTLQSGLAPAIKSTDTTPPAVSINSIAGGLQAGTSTIISGTASDSGGGVVGGVEVSIDGGATWHPANGREQWTVTVSPSTLNAVTFMSRAVDDSGNLSAPQSRIFTVTGHDCPCSIWKASTVPVTVDAGDGSALEVGVRFSPEFDGLITGIRFYKSSGNIGAHTGNLWSNDGTLLASASFAGETGSGWQQVNFSTPVAVKANTVYVASYFAPNGHYSADHSYFGSSGVDNPPLHAIQDGMGGSNGVYGYSSQSNFPSSTFASTNYWVDVVYVPTVPMPGIPASLLVNPSSLNFSGFLGQPNPASQTITLNNQSTDALSWSAVSSAGWLGVSSASGTVPASFTVFVNTAGLAGGTYQGTITITANGANNSPVTVPVTLTLSGLLLTDDFSSGTLDGWVSSPLGLGGDWSVANGALQNNGGGHTQIYAGDAAWTDYNFQADVKLTSLNDWPAGIRGRVNPSTGASYAVWLYPAEGLIRLYRTVGWNIDSGFTTVGQGSIRFDTFFHRLNLVFNGSQIQVLYDGNVVISATDTGLASGMVAIDASTQPVTYDNLLVTAASTGTNSLSVSSSSLLFTGNLQGANPPAQTVQVAATGAGSLAWTAVSTAPWLSVSSAQGITPATLQISTNTSGLASGTYSGSMRLVSLGATNNPVLINVTLNLVVPPPAIVLSQQQMNFSALAGQANPPSQTLSMTNGGVGSISWSATANVPWLSLSSASGSTPASVSVNVNSAGLAPGSYNGAITVTSSGVANSPQTVSVNMTVLAQDLSENFTNQAQGWIISPMGLANGWSVSNGVYSFSGIGFSQSCAGNSSWTDYNFDTNIKLTNLNNWPGGVRARVNPTTGAGYAVWLYPGTGQIILYGVPQWDINGPGLTVLAQANLNFDTTAFHDLQMAFQGSTITVSWDEHPVMGATDSTYTSGFVCMDADSQPISYSNVRVASSQNAATLATTPGSLVFSSQPGNIPGPQTVTIDAGGATTTIAVATNAAWLNASTSSAFTAALGQPATTVTVSVKASGLAAGNYSGAVTVYAPGATNAPLVVPVTLVVSTAALSVSPSSMAFFGAAGFIPASQNLSINNAGTGSLAWNATADSSWISLSASSGSAPSASVVSASTAGLAQGLYHGNVTVSSTNVANGPIVVPVSLSVGNLLFSDDFSSGSASNWTISPLGNAAGWSVVNGAYNYDGAGETQAWAGDPAWTDYNVGVDFTLAAAQDYPGGIRGRVNPATGASYAVWIYPTEGILKLFSVGQWSIDAGFTLLAQSTPVTMNAQKHNIVLSFNGPVIRVCLDGVQVIQVSDSTYSQGAIALDPSGIPITYDNVMVISQ